jgi:acetylornithine deacetylase/succinyl-diaminopimelate desuccinylase-like protein
MLPKAVTEYLASHRQEHLAKLMELIRFPSVANTEPQQCRACADWLAEHLRGLGMTARVEECPGRPNVIGSLHVSDQAPTLLIYGHYDVQPADPLGEWRTGPFDPVVQDGYLCARGSSDDKGQLFAHMAAVEAWQRAGGGVPVNVKVLIEGEEEIGSPNMEAFLGRHAKELSADAVVISDSEFFARGLPSITYALRGLTYVEVIFHGPRADIHSGVHGGAVTNPVNALARLVAAMHDESGRVTIPGYYDDVVPLSPAERDEWRKLPVDDAAYAASLGVEALGAGERGFSVLERRWARPTLDCNGIVGGYTGPGAKTIIPSQASVKISMRLVSNQRPEKALEGFQRFVAEHTPPGIRAELKMNAGARPVMLGQHSPAMDAGRAALMEAFAAPTAMIRCGASVPITELFQRLLGLDAVLMGFGLPDDNLHSPNERFLLEHLWGGMIASAAFMKNLRESLTTAP